MRLNVIGPALLLGLAGCGDNLTDEERERRANTDVAAVEALQDPPAERLVPQPIRYPEIEKHELYGASCAFAPDGGGIGAIALAMADAGYMKIDNSIQRFAPDSGSDENPLGTRVQYSGRSYSFRLALTDGEGRQSGAETTDFPARLEVKDANDRTVYEADGYAQCGV